MKPGRLGRLAAWAGVLLVFLAVAQTASAAGITPGPVVMGGATQPVYGYADAIRERVWVESTFDSDADGANDLIAMDIMRPKATEDGLKVPVIMVASPYYTTLCRGNDGECIADFDADGLNDKWPLFYDNYFVPRGYAVVLLHMVGTGFSTGCPTTGGTPENLSGKVGIDWLNGRATARDDDGNAVVADWHNGRTGMIGKSYDGTLANAVAATGVEGLETIVPISAISSWYDYTRSNGVVQRGNSYPSFLANAVTNPDRRAYCATVRSMLAANDGDEHGDYTPFWAERDYLPDADNVTASVFVVHGINDENVRPDHFSKWWKELKGVRRKLWLTQTGHVEAFDFRREKWVETIHQWFDSELWGVKNGIRDEPPVDIERSADVWETFSDWPDAEMEKVELRLEAGSETAPGVLETGRRPRANEPRVFQTFQDSPTQGQTTMISNLETPGANRLVFLSEPLRQDVRISGTPLVSLRASADQTNTNFGAIIVDYGTDTRVAWNLSGEGIRTLTTEDCWGESSATDDACYRQTEKRVQTTDRERVTKGILDALNRDSLTTPEDLVPGQQYTFGFPLLPEDYVFKAGHRIAFVVVGSYPGYGSQADQTRANITLNVTKSNLELPVVGGEPALKAAGL